MDRRRFTLAALASPALLSGCHSQSKPSRDATLFHNSTVRAAVTELEQAMNLLEERVTSFNAENWQDALSNLQTTSIRLRTDIGELKRALGYEDTSQIPHPGSSSV